MWGKRTTHLSTAQSSTINRYLYFRLKEYHVHASCDILCNLCPHIIIARVARPSFCSSSASTKGDGAGTKWRAGYARLVSTRTYPDVALFSLRSVVCGRDRTGNGACTQINVKRSLAFTDQIRCVYVHAHIVCMRVWRCTCTTDQLKLQGMCIRSFFRACLIAV